MTYETADVAIGAVTDGADALALSSSTLVRFVPAANYNGAAGLTVSRLALGTMTWGRDTDEHAARKAAAGLLEHGPVPRRLRDLLPQYQ